MGEWGEVRGEEEDGDEEQLERQNTWGTTNNIIIDYNIVQILSMYEFNLINTIFCVGVIDHDVVVRFVFHSCGKPLVSKV